MSSFDSPYNSGSAQQPFGLGEPTTPNSATRSFVGFTRKLMNYVSGTPSSERLNALNIDLEKNAGLASITTEYAQASPYSRSYGYGSQPSASAQLPMFSSSGPSPAMNEMEARYFVPQRPLSAGAGNHPQQQPAVVPVPQAASVNFMPMGTPGSRSVPASPARIRHQHHRLSYGAAGPLYQVPDIALVSNTALPDPVQGTYESSQVLAQVAEREALQAKSSVNVQKTNELQFDDEITLNLNPGQRLEAVPSEPLLESDLMSKVSVEAEPVVIPEGWMMSFDSPAQPKSVTPSSAVPHPPSLMDDFPRDIPVMSPRSQAKFNQYDVDSATQSVRQHYEKQMDLMHNELQNMKNKWKETEASRLQMKKVVDEYEKAMGKMIDDSKQEKERHRIQNERIVEEKTRLQTDLASIENSFQELRLRYEDVKTVNEQYRKNEASLKVTIEELRKDIKSSEQRVDAVKQHAEKKLSEASDEISKVQTQKENEIALLRAKLQKADLQIKSLEQTIDQKKTENSELVGICDDLIRKMEKVELNTS